MSRRLGLLLVIGGVGVALVGMLFVGFILRQTTAPAVQVTEAPIVTIPVVVSSRALTVRTLLQASDVAIVQMPVEFAPLDAVSEVEAVVGKISMIPMSAGELVMRHHLADPTNISRDLAFIIDDDQVVMAVPANDLMSQVDILQPGDFVDILASLQVPVLPDSAAALNANAETDAEEEELFTFNALQRLTIQAIVVEVSREARQAAASTTRTSTGTPVPTPTPAPSELTAQAIMIALQPQDALILKHVIDAGGIIDVVLRAPTANQTFELDPVSSEYLKDRYELVPEPLEPR